jgi:hypothetical protein
MAFPASARKPKGAFEVASLAASAARTATGNGSSVKLPAAQAFAFVCDLTAAATDVGDTLNVFIQTKLDGTNWVDVVHFTEMLGNGGAKRYITKITAHVATAEFENGAALGAAAVRNLMGDAWRARWAIVNAGAADQSFTFSITAVPM